MKITKQYIAGFADGEAYIGLVKKTRKDSRLGYYLKPNIKITQRTKCAEVLKLIKDEYGGYLTTRKAIPDKNYCSVDSWEISNRPMILKFITDIQPFSLVKKEQIKLLIEFIRLPHGQLIENRKYQDEKDELYYKLRTINKRGLAETKR